MVKTIKGMSLDKDDYPTVVNHNALIEDLLKIRHYDEVSPFITSTNFPSRKSGKERIAAKIVEIRHRPVFGSSGLERDLHCLRNEGYEVVDLQELLTVLNQHKNIRALPSIMALGSSIEIGDDLKSPFVLEHSCQGSFVGLENV